MELEELFAKWKLNHTHFASLLDMPKGTFNNKLNTKHFSYFSNSEKDIIKTHFNSMIEDLKSFLNTYPDGEEPDCVNDDEPQAHYGKPLN